MKKFLDQKELFEAHTIGAATSAAAAVILFGRDDYIEKTGCEFIALLFRKFAKNLYLPKDLL